jgi:hypothetical protein
MYITRLASNEIFSPSNKILWEVGRDKDLSAPLYGDMDNTQFRCRYLFVMRVGLVISCLSALATDELPRH